MTSTSMVDQRRWTEFLFYPTGWVFGVIDSRPAAEAALHALVAAGYPLDALATWQGADGAAVIDPTGNAHGLLAHLWRLAQRSTEDRRLIERYAEEAQKGHICIGVHVGFHAPKDHDHGRARDLLKAHGAHHVIYCGLMAVEELDV